MKLTHELLMQYRTPAGLWRKVQLQALGLDWPPLKGWIQRVVGMELTDEQFKQFTGHDPDQRDLFG
ncbi:hypothetical protein [Polaromonas naphthalenivorans]|nr:hypothetical protein [Polaromonas naphthalenivorans]